MDTHERCDGRTEERTRIPGDLGHGKINSAKAEGNNQGRWLTPWVCSDSGLNHEQSTRRWTDLQNERLLQERHARQCYMTTQLIIKQSNSEISRLLAFFSKRCHDGKAQVQPGNWWLIHTPEGRTVPVAVPNLSRAKFMLCFIPLPMKGTPEL